MTRLLFALALAGVSAAAAARARLRATQLFRGHTANDFAALPPGCYAAATGCGRSSRRGVGNRAVRAIGTLTAVQRW
jgi:hypothetical protein